MSFILLVGINQQLNISKKDNDMYRCESCGKISKPNEKCFKKIIKKRKRVYDNGSVGWEIEKEINVCINCR